MSDGAPLPPANASEQQLDREWLLVSATREGFSIGRRQAVPYREALHFAVQLAPTLIGPDSLFAQGLEPDLPAYYRAKANALSHSNQVTVSPIELAIADLNETVALIPHVQVREKPALERRAFEIERALHVLDSSNWTETQAIFRDQLSPPKGEGIARLPISGRGQDYLEFDVRETGRSLRARVLHPDPGEWKTGVDLIYEHYWVDWYKGRPRARVRLAALQYKRWDGKRLSLDKEGRVQRQLTRAHSAFCNSGLCTPASGPTGYRLPHCAAFLRPTDRIQTRRGWNATKGWHVPICTAQAAIRESPTGSSIGADAIRNSSLTQPVFESLFAREMLGSEWLPIAILEEVYEKAGIFTDVTTPMLHMQEFPRERIANLG